MADITMCANNICEIRYSCVRYLATPNKYNQSYLWKPSDNCEKKNHKLHINNEGTSK